MTTTAVRLIGHAALGAGYAMRALRTSGERLLTLVNPTRDWRRIEANGISLQVPPGWGDIEPLEDGAIVVHNRPPRHRVEGDAVWYGSAIELQISLQDLSPLPPLAPMDEVRRTIRSASAVYTASLRIAKGVGAGHRRQALRVLASIRVRQ